MLGHHGRGSMDIMLWGTIKFLRLIYHSQHPSGARVHSGERLLVPSPQWQDHDHLKYYPVLVTSRIFLRFDSFSIGPMVAHWCSDHCQLVASGRPVGCQKKQWWWWAVGGRWASCQCPDSRNSVGCRRSTSEAFSRPLGVCPVGH